MTDITVPQLGESVTEATVGQWLKAAGDAVSKDEVLVELETDKVSIEVSAPENGTLSEIAAEEGAIVNIGALLGKVGGSNGAAKPAPKAKAPTAAKPASPAKAAKSSAGTSIEVVIPTMGESVTEGTVAALLKQPGDAVVKDESLIEIETDKVAIEVPSPADGVVAEYLVAEGDIVTPGAVIARVTAGTDATASAPATATPTALVLRVQRLLRHLYAVSQQKMVLIRPRYRAQVKAGVPPRGMLWPISTRVARQLRQRPQLKRHVILVHARNVSACHVCARPSRAA